MSADKQDVVTVEPPQEAATNIIQVIERAAMNPDVDIDKMERLLQMQERILDRQSEQEFNTAMNLCQEEMTPISQDASNPQTRSKYASYTALDKVMRAIYTGHGFSLSYNTDDGAPEGHVRVVCKVSHTSGHSDLKHLDMPNDGKGAKGGDVMTKTHATMSAVSYARRGLLKMIFNIAEGEADDDGNKGGGGDKITQEQANELTELADELGADKIKFCKMHKVESFPEISADKYTAAKKALQAYGEKHGVRQ